MSWSYGGKTCECCGRNLMYVQMDVGYVELICPVCDNNLCEKCKRPEPNWEEIYADQEKRCASA